MKKHSYHFFITSRIKTKTLLHGNQLNDSVSMKANQTNVHYVTGSNYELKNSRFIHGLGMKSFIHDFLVSSLVVFNE